MTPDGRGLRGGHAPRPRVFQDLRGLSSGSARSGSATRRYPRWVLLGAAVGAALTGIAPRVEIMFIEFLGVAFDQVVTEEAMMPLPVPGGAERSPHGAGLVRVGPRLRLPALADIERWLLGTPG